MGKARQGSASNIRVGTCREIVQERESSVCKRCRRKCRDMVPEEKRTGNIVTGVIGGRWGFIGCPGVARLPTGAGAGLFVSEQDT